MNWQLKNQHMLIYLSDFLSCNYDQFVCQLALATITTAELM